MARLEIKSAEGWKPIKAKGSVPASDRITTRAQALSFLAGQGLRHRTPENPNRYPAGSKLRGIAERLADIDRAFNAELDARAAALIAKGN